MDYWSEIFWLMEPVVSQMRDTMAFVIRTRNYSFISLEGKRSHSHHGGQ